MVTNFDVNEDGVDEVVTGWTSGRVDVKALDTGQLLYKDTLPAAIAGIVKVYMYMHKQYTCTHNYRWKYIYLNLISHDS